MIKKLIFIAIIIVLIIIFYSLGRQIYDSLQISKRVEQETEELVNLQQKNLELKKKLAEVQTFQFIEQQARDKLNLAREGETVVIIPQKSLEKILGAQKEKIIEVLPNWMGWIKLFFK
ncbi:MAG: septum formation initiator family protein [Candidatus Daviesbacteria bacterium]